VIVPATQKVYMQAMKEGLIEQFIEAGAAVTTLRAGPASAATMARWTTAKWLLRRLTVISRDAPAMRREGVPRNSYVAAAAAVAGEIIDPALI